MRELGSRSWATVGGVGAVVEVWTKAMFFVWSDYGCGEGGGGHAANRISSIQTTLKSKIISQFMRAGSDGAVCCCCSRYWWWEGGRVGGVLRDVRVCDMFY